MYEDNLPSDSVHDVESFGSDYMPQTFQKQRKSTTSPVVCISVSDDSEASDDKPNESDSDSRESDFHDIDSSHNRKQ
jgi:hypothetical protein